MCWYCESDLWKPHASVFLYQSTSSEPDAPITLAHRICRCNLLLEIFQVTRKTKLRSESIHHQVIVRNQGWAVFIFAVIKLGLHSAACKKPSWVFSLVVAFIFFFNVSDTIPVNVDANFFVCNEWSLRDSTVASSWWFSQIHCGSHIVVGKRVKVYWSRLLRSIPVGRWIESGLCKQTSRNSYLQALRMWQKVMHTINTNITNTKTVFRTTL